MQGWERVICTLSVRRPQPHNTNLPAYAAPHDIVYKTTKTVCMLVRPKQSQGRHSTRVRLGNVELCFIQEFRYLAHVMTPDCRDDKDIKKTIHEAKCCWEYAGQEVLVCTYWGKNPTASSSHIVTPFMDVLFGVIHTRNLLENLLSVLVTHSSVL